MREGLFVISRGIGQVMFQNNAFSGILMLSGILYSSWQLALLAIIGNIISTATAWICSYSREDIKNGLYGFNGTLVGIAIGVFIEITWLSMLLLLITSALSTWITYLIVYPDIRLPLFYLYGYYWLDVTGYFLHYYYPPHLLGQSHPLISSALSV